MKRMRIILLIISVISITTYADDKIRKEYKIVSSWHESVEVYKAGNGYSLNAHIFTPTDISRNAKRPAILFFHGGGWFEGNPAGFKRNCKTFTQKGWVSISFEYRLSNFKDINPVHCIMDAKSAVRWVRSHSKRLTINPEKIVIAGQSAGGHIALCTGLISDFNDEKDDLHISCIPDAILCYSACFDTQRDPWFIRLLPENMNIGETSPYYHIKSGIPPILIFHGKKDDLVSYQQAADFYNKMLEFENYCVLYSFESGGHNLWPSYYHDIRITSENFLIELGFTMD